MDVHISLGIIHVLSTAFMFLVIQMRFYHLHTFTLVNNIVVVPTN